MKNSFELLTGVGQNWFFQWKNFNEDKWFHSISQALCHKVIVLLENPKMSIFDSVESRVYHLKLLVIIAMLCSADQALDRFAMKKFYDDKIGGVTHPSQRR